VLGKRFQPRKAGCERWGLNVLYRSRRKENIRGVSFRKVIGEDQLRFSVLRCNLPSHVNNFRQVTNRPAHVRGVVQVF
jgi:hypothetical protein